MYYWRSCKVAVLQEKRCAVRNSAVALLHTSSSVEPWHHTHTKAPGNTFDSNQVSHKKPDKSMCPYI